MTVEGIIVADIPISIYVKDHTLDSSTYKKFVCQFYKSIFCSYSHKDEHIVERIESAYRALGIEYLRDITTLRSGELWSDRLMDLIEKSDIFQLFWSPAAAASKYVEKEWRYALKLEREGFIRPVRWIDPIQPSPPTELQHLHFAYVPELSKSIAK